MKYTFVKTISLLLIGLLYCGENNVYGQQFIDAIQINLMGFRSDAIHLSSGRESSLTENVESSFSYGLNLSAIFDKSNKFDLLFGMGYRRSEALYVLGSFRTTPTENLTFYSKNINNILELNFKYRHKWFGEHSSIKKYIVFGVSPTYVLASNVVLEIHENGIIRMDPALINEFDIPKLNVFLHLGMDFFLGEKK